MASIASLVVTLGADIKDFQTDLQRAGAISKKELAQMESQAKQLNDTWNRNFKLAGAAVAAAIVVATKSALDFEKAMAEVSTLLSDTTPASMKKTSDAIKDISVQFGQAPVEEAKALYQIISAGATDAATQIEQLTVANKLAVGGVTDVATAADGLTSVFNAYAGTGLEVNRISDIMFATMRLGKTTIGELSANVGNVVTIAAQAGVSFEELGASVATVTVSGLSTSSAMDGLRGVLASVLKQSDQTKKAAAELGIEFNVSRVKAVGLDGVLKDIANSGVTEEQLAHLVGRIEGLTNILATVRNNGEAFTKNLEEIKNSAGATDEALSKMMESASFKAEQARAAFEVLKIEIGEKFLAAVASTADGFVNNLDAIAKSIEIVAELLAVRLGIVGVAGILAAASAGTGLATAMAVLGGPIGAVALAFTGLLIVLDSFVERQFRVFESMPVNTDLLIKQAKAYRELGDAVKLAALAEDLAAKQAQLKEEIKNTTAELIKLSKEYQTAVKWTGETSQFSEGLKVKIEELAVSLKNAFKNLGAHTIEIEKIGEETKVAAKETETLVKETADLDKALKNAKKAFKDADTELENVIKSLDDLLDSEEKYNEELQETKDLLDPVGALVRTFESAVAAADVMLKRDGITLDEYNKRLNQLSDGLGKAVKGLEETAEASEESNEAILEGIRIVERVFTDVWSGVLDGTLDVFDAMSDGFKVMLAQMLHHLISAPLINELEKAFGEGGGGFGSLDFGTIGGSLAGLAGITIGSLLGGGGTGAGIGSALGAIAGSFIPGLGNILGAAIGGIVGGLLGGLFDSDNPAVVQASGFDTSALSGSDLDTQASSIFGTTFLRTRELDAAAVQQFVTGLEEFDNAIGSFLSDSQIDTIADALADWSLQIEGETLSLEDLLNLRLVKILSTFSTDVQDFVNDVAGLEERLNRLQVAISAENLIGSSPELFGTNTLNDFLAVVESFQDGTESIIDAFNEVVELMAAVAFVTALLSDYGASNLIDDYAALVALRNESLADTVSRLGTELKDAIEGFDGSTDALFAIGDKVAEIRQMELDLLTQIDAIAESVANKLQDLREFVTGVIEGPKSAGEILAEASDLISAVSGATSAEEIDSITSDFDALIRSLSDEDIAAFGGDILSLIDLFDTKSATALETFRQKAIDDAAELRTAIGDLAIEIGDPLSFIAASNERIAAAVEAIATGSTLDLTKTDTDPTALAFEQAGILSDGINQTLQDGLNSQAEILNAGNTALNTTMSNQLGTMSQALAAAVQTGFAGANFIVIVSFEEDALVTG